MPGIRKWAGTPPDSNCPGVKAVVYVSSTIFDESLTLAFESQGHRLRIGVHFELQR